MLINKAMMLATAVQPAKLKFTFKVDKVELRNDFLYSLNVGYSDADNLGDISPSMIGGCRILYISYNYLSSYGTEVFYDYIEIEGTKFVGKKLKLTNPSGESLTADLKESKGNARYEYDRDGSNQTPLEKIMVNFINTTKTWELEILDGEGGVKTLIRKIENAALLQGGLRDAKQSNLIRETDSSSTFSSGIPFLPDCRISRRVSRKLCNWVEPSVSGLLFPRSYSVGKECFCSHRRLDTKSRYRSVCYRRYIPLRREDSYEFHPSIYTEKQARRGQNGQGSYIHQVAGMASGKEAAC